MNVQLKMTIMKFLQKFKWILILFLALAATQSCEKEEIVFLDPDTDNAITDNNNGDSDSDTDGNGSDTNTDGSGDSDNDNSDTDSNATGEEGDITLYRVDGSDLVKVQDYNVSGTALEFQNDTAKHQEVWELVKKIIPDNYLSKISDFILFAGEASGTAGYVFETANDLSTWRMGIAIDFAYEGGFNANGELAYTIIHEFGHILTLDNTQVDSSIAEDNCQNFFTGEGCANTDSYINKLQRRFWGDIWNEFMVAREDFDQLDQFYNKYQDRFVTAYAATNPGEDIAEVFATFVTRNDGPNGNSIAEQKIKLMYDHAELVSLRNFIRGNMASSKGRSYLPVAGSWKKGKTVGNPKKGCTHHKKAA